MGKFKAGSKVLEVMELYEDELPSPLTKMGKTYLS